MNNICPKCGVNECYKENYNKEEIQFCLGCGYRTSEKNHVKYFEFQSTIINLDSKIKDMVWKDSKTGLYWFPSSFDIKGKGVLYPEGKLGDIKYIYMPMIRLDDEEKKRYPGKTEKPDIVFKKEFKENEFKEVCKLLELFK